ncbi:MAG: LuxR family transcriptional regulator [Sphingobacteriales bacterium]|nr:MAG: LuxR family transcriptional regulator [Sphingobacteriales bacterium]
MSTKLCVQVSSFLQPKKLEVEFIYNEEWTADAEVALLQKLHEILAVVRKEGNSLGIRLEIDVKNPAEAIFLIRKKLNDPKKLAIRNYSLSIREIEILGLIMSGHTNHQIAEKLFISYETVRSHRKHILAKTGASNTAALINYYHQTFFEK